MKQIGLQAYRLSVMWPRVIKRFGLIHVDYRTQKRTIKDSGYWYSRVISSNGAVLDEGGDA